MINFDIRINSKFLFLFALSYSLPSQAQVQACYNDAKSAIEACDGILKQGHAVASQSDMQIAQSSNSVDIYTNGVSLQNATAKNASIWSTVSENCQRLKDKCETSCKKVVAPDGAVAYAKDIQQKCENAIDKNIALAEQAKSQNLSAHAQARDTASAAQNRKLTPSQQALQDGANRPNDLTGNEQQTAWKTENFINNAGDRIIEVQTGNGPCELITVFNGDGEKIGDYQNCK